MTKTLKVNVVIIMVMTIFARSVLVSCLVNFKYDPIIISKAESNAVQSITPSDWLDFTRRGIESDNQEKRLETQLVNANVIVQNGTLSHVQLLDTLPNDEARRDSEVADKILKSSLYIYNSKCATLGVAGDRCEAILSDCELPRNSELRAECDSVIESRRKSHYPFRRLLPRHYVDGFYRMFSDNLPAPLAISSQLCGDKIKREFVGDNHRNLAVVQWAQFVANDLSKTVVTTMSNGAPIECCNAQNYKLQSRHYHPACEPLTSRNAEDRYGFTTCLNYVRSAMAVGNRCTFAAPEQLNQATADLDLSPLYGFTEVARHRMRSYKNGFLKSTEVGRLEDALLPRVTKDMHNFCARKTEQNFNNISRCFMAGDSRVNSNPFAIVIYTLFMRNHNRLAGELKQKHPQWADEQLFQRAKTINTDIYLKVVFDEWLPMVLGKTTADEIKSQRGQSSSNRLEATQQQQVSNEYAVAAARFYLSMMPNVLHSFSQEMDLVTELPTTTTTISAGKNVIPDLDIFTLKYQLYNTNITYTSKKLDEILNALLQQRTMKMDVSYVESLISDFMGSTRPTHSDALAFDIQRGRDHGLQPYYKYLEICNNIKVHNWNDLKKFIALEDVDKLQKVYTNWQDVDLIVGGISEIPARDATVGPTFQCIMAEQFSQLRQWHHRDITEYNETTADIIKYKSTKAADLLCLNSNLKYVPSNIFQIPSDKNPVLACADLVRKYLPGA